MAEGSNNSIEANPLVAGNIKKILLPFTLSPKNNKDNNAVNSTPDVFSFRYNDVDEAGTCGMRIHLFPDDRTQFNRDVSLKLILSKFFKDNDEDYTRSTLDRILENCPGIQISEYQQDTKLEMVWNLVSNLASGIMKGIDFAKGSVDEAIEGISTMEEYSKYTTAFGEMASSSLKDMSDNGFIATIANQISNFFGTNSTYPSQGLDANALAIKLVQALYYRMIGATHTGVYILPNTSTDYLNADGSQGWGGQNQFGWNGTSNNSWLGKLMNFVLPNLKVVTQPIWKPDISGNGPKIDIKFDLFNDTLEHALHNFLFVNTIMPSAMPLQYGLFQLPPSYYDVKIEGGYRLFMCSGSFKCTNGGVVRQPPKKMIEKLLTTYVNANSFSSKTLNKDSLHKDKIIMIPDVYQMTLSFQSLLPENLNNYLFQFSSNNSMDSGVGKGIQPFYNDGSITSAIENKVKEWHNTALKAATKETAKEAQEEALEKISKFQLSKAGG